MPEELHLFHVVITMHDQSKSIHEARYQHALDALEIARKTFPQARDIHVAGGPYLQPVLIQGQKTTQSETVCVGQVATPRIVKVMHTPAYVPQPWSPPRPESTQSEQFGSHGTRC
jgi:hypothetical protein